MKAAPKEASMYIGTQQFSVYLIVADLFHSMAGISRSPTIVAAYLMKK